MARLLLVGPELEENLSVRYLSSSLIAAGHDTEMVSFNTIADIESVIEAAGDADLVGRIAARHPVPGREPQGLGLGLHVQPCEDRAGLAEAPGAHVHEAQPQHRFPPKAMIGQAQLQGAIEVPGRLDLGRHIGQHELYPLKRGDGLAELAALLAVPYLLQGLAVVHSAADRVKARGLVLAAFYIVLLLFSWPLLVGVVLLGLLEDWAQFRRRMA